jgi:hypothetical protein
MTDIDLERPEPEEKPASDRRRESDERQGRRKRADIRERLFAIFNRLADSREGRGDVELAAMIREDSRAMVEGLLSVTRRAPGLAPAIMGALAVLEPLIAFGRIAKLLGGRFAERRARAYEDVFEPEPDTPEPVAPEPPSEPEPETAQPWLDV